MAKQKTYPVSSTIDGKRTPIGEATYYEFESIEDAVNILGQETVLELVNTQHKTNEMNKVRAEFTAGPSKAVLENEAMIILTTTRLADLQACAGDGAKIMALKEKIVNELKEQHEANRRERAARAAANAKAAGITGDSSSDDDSND